MRYGGEVHLRFFGPPDVCRLYVPRARVILGDLIARDRELGGLDFSFRRVTMPDGTVITAHAIDPVPIISIWTTESPALPEDISRPAIRAVWEPKGIMFTPTSEAEPDGWGLPTRHKQTGDKLAGLGTLGGRLPQVIINKYADNNYLDQFEYIAGYDAAILASLGANERLRAVGVIGDGDYPAGGSPQYAHWQPLYQPLDCGADPATNGIEFWAESPADIPGLYQGDALLQPQYAGGQSEVLLFEAKGTEWHSHRAEETLYANEGQESLFRETNNLRASVGEDAVFRPLRGRANIGLISATEMALAGIQYHNNNSFRPGYRQTSSRAAAAQTVAAVGENLLITTAPASVDGGIFAYTVWAASPVHYANLVEPFWSSGFVGTEMLIGIVPAAITETESLGVLDNPIVGNEWSQIFAASWSLLPAPFNYTESEQHVIGNYGKPAAHDRGGYYEAPTYFFVAWGQVVLAIPMDLLPETAYAVLGAAAYQPDTGGTRIRCVLACGDQGRDKEDHDWFDDKDDFSIAVLTTEIQSTGVSDVDEFDVTGACRWEVEAVETFTLVDEWLASPPGQVKFSPDGTKFVFTMNKLGQRYSTLGSRYLTTFLTPHGLDMHDNVDVSLFRIEYSATPPLFDHTQIEMPGVSVSSAETRDSEGEGDTLIASSYSRSVAGDFPAFFDYDDNNDLIACRVSIIETQVTGYPVGPNNCSRTRKLIFPSGKEVVYLQEDLVGHAGVTEFLCFYHIDVRTEDCVFARRIAATDAYVTKKNLDNAIIDKTYIMHTGEYTIEVDVGFSTDRVVAVLWSDGEGVAAAIFNSNGNGYNVDTHSFEQPRYTYQAGTTPNVYTAGNTPLMAVSSLPIINNTAIGVDTDYVNSILLQVHKVNFMPGFPARVVGDNNAFGPIQRAYATGNTSHVGTRATFDMFVTLRQASIAPIIVPDTLAATCQVVRCDDRVMVRLENRLLPWRNLDVDYDGTHEGLPVIDKVNNNWHVVPDAAKVLVWANFDIDEAAGMSDVTDIQPFGRVG